MLGHVCTLCWAFKPPADGVPAVLQQVQQAFLRLQHVHESVRIAPMRRSLNENSNEFERRSPPQKAGRAAGGNTVHITANCTAGGFVGACLRVAMRGLL